MDYRKLDAALAAALVGAAGGGPGSGGDPRTAPGHEPTLSVFVHVDPEAPDDEREALARLGLSPRSLRGGIGTATLSPSQVAELSEQPCVRSIRLSTPMRLLGGD